MRKLLAVLFIGVLLLGSVAAFSGSGTVKTNDSDSNNMHNDNTGETDTQGTDTPSDRSDGLFNGLMVFFSQMWQ